MVHPLSSFKPRCIVFVERSVGHLVIMKGENGKKFNNEGLAQKEIFYAYSHTRGSEQVTGMDTWQSGYIKSIHNIQTWTFNHLASMERNPTIFKLWRLIKLSDWDSGAHTSCIQQYTKLHVSNNIQNFMYPTIYNTYFMYPTITKLDRTQVIISRLGALQSGGL